MTILPNTRRAGATRVEERDLRCFTKETTTLYIVYITIRASVRVRVSLVRVGVSLVRVRHRRQNCVQNMENLVEFERERDIYIFR